MSVVQECRRIIGIILYELYEKLYESYMGISRRIVIELGKRFHRCQHT